MQHITVASQEQSKHQQHGSTNTNYRDQIFTLHWVLSYTGMAGIFTCIGIVSTSPSELLSSVHFDTVLDAS